MKPNLQSPEPSPEHGPNITDLERSVLTALWESSYGNGHDFGLVEDCRAACAPQQLGGVISSLSKKGIIIVHEAVVTQSGRWTQTQWASGWSPERVKALTSAIPSQSQEAPVMTAASLVALSAVGAEAIGLPLDPVLAENAKQAKAYFEWMLDLLQDSVNFNVLAIHVAPGAENDLKNNWPTMQVRMEGEAELHDLADYVQNNSEGNPNHGDDLGDCLSHARALVAAEGECWIGEAP